MIDFYGCRTPNCLKVAIALLEVQEPFVLRLVDIERGEQHAPAFKALNPNSKVPVIVDRRDTGSSPLVVWESGAILLYLAEKHARLYGASHTERAATAQWLMWQMSALGPTAGQLAYFGRRSPRRLPLAIERFSLELHRLWAVLDTHLREHRFVAGETLSVADIAIFPWWVALREVPLVARRSAWADRWLPAVLNLRRTPSAPYRRIEAWAESLQGRPAVQQAMTVFDDGAGSARFATAVPIGQQAGQLGDASAVSRA